MPSAPPELTIIESTGVAPSPGTVSNAILPLTFFDVFWVHHLHPSVERLFFYRYPDPANRFFSTILPSLKSSLSIVLAKFYPLAGKLILVPGTDNKYEIRYTNGDSVSFTIAQCEDGKFEEFSGHHARECSKFQRFVPEVPKSGEFQLLFSVMVTVFPEQGVIIGITVNHTVCDGTSSMQFVHEWAAACRLQTSSDHSPVIDRTLIPDDRNIYSIFHDRMLELKRFVETMPVAASPSSVEELVMLATFTLTREHIRNLKRFVSNDAKQRNVSFHCSSIVVSVAYAVLCYARAKRFGNSGRVGFGMPADFRARIQPPLPNTYFGNCVWFVWAAVEVSDLIKENGVALAAEAIGKDIGKLSEGIKGAENWFQPFKSFADLPFLGAAGSPRFKVYDVDFGFGKPEKVEIVSATKTGALSLAESRDEPGGVEIGLALPKRWTVSWSILRMV